MGCDFFHSRLVYSLSCDELVCDVIVKNRISISFFILVCTILEFENLKRKCWSCAGKNAPEVDACFPLRHICWLQVLNSWFTPSKMVVVGFQWINSKVSVYCNTDKIPSSGLRRKLYHLLVLIKDANCWFQCPYGVLFNSSKISSFRKYLFTLTSKNKSSDCQTSEWNQASFVGVYWTEYRYIGSTIESTTTTWPRSNSNSPHPQQDTSMTPILKICLIFNWLTLQ